MANVTRREFIRRAAKAGLAVGLGAQLEALAGCGSGGGSTVAQPSGAYDVIVVGGGTAGSIVATKLRMATRGRKRILVIDAGGGTSAAIGGTDFPPWLPPNRRDLTIFDVPGEYSQIANMPLGKPYQLTETGFTYQGIGLGGNSQYNGMLFQTNPPAVFDASWPDGWHWTDMEPYYARVRQNVPVTNTPSHPLYATQGWIEGDTSEPFTASGVYSRPYVAAMDGHRAGPISGYFVTVAPGGNPKANLEILRFSKVDKIRFNTDGAAIAVEYRRRAGLDQSDAGVKGVAKLRSGGMLVMAAGALITPRILLLSGVGPAGMESQIFPDGPPGPFTIDNPSLGVGVFDHVMTMVTYEYTGAVPYQVYNYGDYAGHQAYLDNYLKDGRGPYAQYQPVSILNYSLNSSLANIEIFLNPNGAGAPGSIYYGLRTLSAFLMLLNPTARGMVALDAGGNVIAPNIYLPGTPDGAADTDLMTQAVFNMIQLFAHDPGSRSCSGPAA